MLDLISRWFGQKTFSRALDYLQLNRVLSYHYDEEHQVLSGQVMGNRSEPYTPEIDFVFTDFDPDGGPIGDCSCPVGSGCKHACALLLTVARDVGGDTLKRWINNSHPASLRAGVRTNRVPTQEQQLLDHIADIKQRLPQDIRDIFYKDEPEEPDTSFISERHKFRYNYWLKELQEAATEAPAPAPSYKPSNHRRSKRYILYLLTFNQYSAQVSLSLETSQQLKRGGHGALKPIKDLSRLTWDDQPPFSAEDRTLIQQLFGAGILDPFNRYNQYGGEDPDLDEKSPEALFALAPPGVWPGGGINVCPSQSLIRRWKFS